MKKYFILLMLSFLFTSACLKAMRDPNEVTESTALSAKKKEKEKTESNLSPQKSKEEGSRDLIFLDGNLPKDSLNFLATKFPKLVKESNLFLEEENNYESSSIPKEREGKTPQEWFIENGKLALKTSLNFFPISDEEKQIQETQLIGFKTLLTEKNLSTSEEFILRRFIQSEKTILEDIVLAAKQIEIIREKHGRAPVLFLGRTPCFVQVCYEELLKLKGLESTITGDIVQLSFSGNPDALTSRKGEYYKDQNRNNLRNMVTPEKLTFYEEYMTEKGLNKIGNKIYLVDMLGSGTSLNSFLRIFRHYYESYLKTTIPNVHFISLSLPLNGAHSAWTFNEKTGFLTFKSIPKLGIRPLQLKTTPFPLAFGTLRYCLDNDACQYFLLHGIEFPAQKWNKQFNDQLNQGGKWHQEFYEWFRPQARKLLTTYDMLIKLNSKSSDVKK